VDLELVDTVLLVVLEHQDREMLVAVVVLYVDHLLVVEVVEERGVLVQVAELVVVVMVDLDMI
jgi:hypothetical protein